jgi:hypothetical protein
VGAGQLLTCSKELIIDRIISYVDCKNGTCPRKSSADDAVIRLITCSANSYWIADISKLRQDTYYHRGSCGEI